MSFLLMFNSLGITNIIFDTGISDYVKIQYLASYYDEIEKNINHMRR